MQANFQPFGREAAFFQQSCVDAFGPFRVAREGVLDTMTARPF